jgi:hypothetical protein
MPIPDQIETRPTYLSLAQVVRRFPPNRDDKPVHVATLTRWILKGCRATDGSQTKLHAVRFPAGWRTTDEWISEFLEAITRDRLGQPGIRPEMIQTSARRRRDIERAERKLDAAGI